MFAVTKIKGKEKVVESNLRMGIGNVDLALLVATTDCD